MVLVPDVVIGFGSVVIAEGYDEANLLWWVHAWTLTDDGIISEVREYINTSLTVTQLGNNNGESNASPLSSPSSSSSSVGTSMCQSIWKSKLCDESVPGLILAV